MIENIKYALVDIKKHKYYFISVITYLTVFMIVSLMLISTVYQGIQEMKTINSGEIIKVPITPLSYDLSFDSDYVEIYSNILKAESFTYMPIRLNINNTDVNGYIILGDTDLLGLEIDSSKRFEVYTTLTTSESNVQINDNLVSMKEIDLNNVPQQLDFLFSSVDHFVVYEENMIKEVINNYSIEDSNYFFEFF